MLADTSDRIFYDAVSSISNPDTAEGDSDSQFLSPLESDVLSSSPGSPTVFSAITWPSDGQINVRWIQNMISVFDWSSRNLHPSRFHCVLPVDVFDHLVLRASKTLHKEPNCVKIESFGVDSRVVVVGDLHGQLHDLLYLLKEAGCPSDNNIYVFNGDYVDRGAWGVETFLVLLAWKLLLPQSVFLLRGNHESKYCTTVYGFENEVMTKYGNQGRHVYYKFLGCFEGLPLASIIAGSVYTAHGGIFRSTSTLTSKRSRKKKKNPKICVKSNYDTLSVGSLEELASARRSVLDPPWEGINVIPGDVLWSDPSMDPGLSPNTERGIGLLWGPDSTEEFLRKFHLKLIIRSHEGPDAREKRPGLGGMSEGYTIDHVVQTGKLVTLFSAPDYPQFQATEKRYANKGAYIVLQPPNFDTPVFHSFEAVVPRPEVKAYYNFEDVIDSDEEMDLTLLVSS